MALTAHHLEMLCSQRIQWLLEELSVPHILKTYRRGQHINVLCKKADLY